jgi:glyoxylase-like metal-dependent hydrolase (beta-lactamase superfamily II)
MNLTPFISHGISANAYLIRGEKTVLIDAGLDPDVLRISKIDTLINTHCHLDHIGLNKKIQEKTGCGIWMGEEEAEFFETERRVASAADLFQLDYDLDFKISKGLKDGDVVDLGKTRLRVIHTPGHTPGGICLYDEDSKALFSGDTIFAEGFGRYDLFGGDETRLRNSIKKLSKLEIRELYPGHGPPLKSGVDEYIKRVLHLF